jgi:hypothetical protein
VTSRALESTISDSTEALPVDLSESQSTHPHSNSQHDFAANVRHNRVMDVDGREATVTTGRLTVNHDNAHNESSQTLPEPRFSQQRSQNQLDREQRFVETAVQTDIHYESNLQLWRCSLLREAGTQTG